MKSACYVVQPIWPKLGYEASKYILKILGFNSAIHLKVKLKTFTIQNKHKNKVNAHTCQVQKPSFLVDDKASLVLHQPFLLAIFLKK